MFDPSFDPLQTLRQCEIDSKIALRNSIELAKAHNAQDAIVMELTNQHRQFLELIRNMRREIEQLKQIQNATLESIRSSHDETGTT
jgi:hemerythrin-like domain-containing protein